jgi:hypothetical protein
MAAQRVTKAERFDYRKALVDLGVQFEYVEPLHLKEVRETYSRARSQSRKNVFRRRYLEAADDLVSSIADKDARLDASLGLDIIRTIFEFELLEKGRYLFYMGSVLDYIHAFKPTYEGQYEEILNKMLELS